MLDLTNDAMRLNLGLTNHSEGFKLPKYTLEERQFFNTRRKRLRYSEHKISSETEELEEQNRPIQQDYIARKGIKKCMECEEELTIDNFKLDNSRKDKLNCRCNECLFVRQIERNSYTRSKRKTDINFKIASSLRTRIQEALKGIVKSEHSIKLLGCNIEFARKYLEKKFKPGMTWNNWGNGWNGKGMKEWHIDHIRPCSNFDLKKLSEQYECFNYTNLQPLWAKENWIKNNKD